MKGIDISNNNQTINFEQVKNDEVELVYIKATEGTTYVDGDLEKHYQGAIKQGLKVGFYHFLVGTSQPETQAENFYNSIKDKQNDLKPCLDVEKDGFDVMGYVTRFISKFEQLCNFQICIYTGPYFANDNLDKSLAKYPCWIAEYGVDTPMPTEIWGNNYAGHQYTDKGVVSGISDHVDMSNFTEKILINNVSNDIPRQVEIHSDILDLQKALNIQGFRDKDGNNLKEDGMLGELTISACPVLHKGAQGEITKVMQNLIIKKGYSCGDIGADSYFGDDTYNSVLKFQDDNGLTSDGIVGQNTWSILLKS